MSSILLQLERIWTEAQAIWLSGGWAMIALAVNAFVIFGIGVNAWLKLRAKGFHAVREQVWRRWIDHPDERKGPIGDLLDLVANGHSPAESAALFEEVRTQEIKPFERDLKVMRIAVSTAPLLGLLGTVTGMLTTFAALSSGSGGDQTMGMVAAGISEALVTTETGLVIALPGLFFQYQLARRHEHYRAFLTHLETVCAQTFHRRHRIERRAA